MLRWLLRLPLLLAALASKPYSELQAMAKARGIRANTKKEVMVEALVEAAGGQ